MVSSVSVIGLGKLGSPMAACFAARGFRVHAVDVDPEPVARRVNVQRGRHARSDRHQRPQTTCVAARMSASSGAYKKNSVDATHARIQSRRV